MRIISDITGKSYDTVDECLEAEKKHNEELALRKAKEEELVKNRRAKAKEVQDAYEAYHEKLREFCKEYGTYHMTIRDDDGCIPTLYSLVEKLLEF